MSPSRTASPRRRAPRPRRVRGVVLAAVALLLAGSASTQAAADPADTVVQALGASRSVRYTAAGAATLAPELTTMGTSVGAYDGSLAPGAQAVRVRTVLPAGCGDACDAPASVVLTFSAPVTDPVVHVSGLALGAGSGPLLTSSADLASVSGSPLTVGDGRVVSADRTRLASCADGTACGSLRVSGTVEMVTFTVPGTDAASRPVAVEDLRFSTSVAALAVAPTANPELSLDRTVSPPKVNRVGQEVMYTFTATNRGDVALTDVAIVNELDGLSRLACTPAQPSTVDPGKTLRCTGTFEVTQATLDFGGLYDVAQVFGEAPDGDTTDPSDDIGAVASGEVTITQSPALSLALTAGPNSAAAGDTVTYTFVTTNVGNVTVTRVGPSGGTFFTGLTCSKTRTLAPGATLTCTATHVVTDTEARTGTLTARGLVRAERPFGDPAVTADDVTARAAVAIDLRKPTSSPRPSTAPTRDATSGPSGGTVTNPASPDTGPGGGSLPDTGGAPAWLIGVGVLLVAVGALLTAGSLLIARRRA